MAGWSGDGLALGAGHRGSADQPTSYARSANSACGYLQTQAPAGSRCFTGWEIHVDETIPAAATEERNSAQHELRSTLIKFVAQAPH
jgi:hypothetical protein